MHACRMTDPCDQRINPIEKGAVVGITASSAALVVAQQAADFAVTTDHLAGARVSVWLPHLCFTAIYGYDSDLHMYLKMTAALSVSCEDF